MAPYIRSRTIRSFVAPSTVTIELDMYITISFQDGTQRQFYVVNENGIMYTTSVAGYKLLVYPNSYGGVTLFRTMYFGGDMYVISVETRQLMRVVVVDGVIKFVVIVSIPNVIKTAFLPKTYRISIIYREDVLACV